MKILSDLDWQIINYFYSQFKHIGSLFYLSPTYGAMLYISTVAYIITFPFSNNTKTNNNRAKRTRL